MNLSNFVTNRRSRFFEKTARRRRKIGGGTHFSIVVHALLTGHRDDMDLNSTSECVLTQPKPHNISHDAHQPRKSHADFEVPQISPKNTLFMTVT